VVQHGSIRGIQNETDRSDRKGRVSDHPRCARTMR